MVNKLAKAGRHIWMGLVWIGSALFPVDQKKIVFSSFYGRGYGGNPKYIAEAMRQRDLPWKMIWLVQHEQDGKNLPEGILPCKRISVKGIYHLVTAGVWVDNCRKAYIFKRKKQYYIQTWHGFPLKQIEKDVQSNLHRKYVATAKWDSRAVDLMISDSDFLTALYRRSFWYSGEIAQWGSPRNDCILMESQREKCRENVEKEYSIPSGTKLLLYAPTFRGDKSLDPYRLDLQMVKRACEERFSGNFAILVRLHPNIADKSQELAIHWNDHLIDATRYPDSQELLAASDVMITDYSSVMFDFALSGKPCFQFATDIPEYKKDRDFYFPLDQLPFPLAQSNKELEMQILDFQSEVYAQSVQRFFASVGMIQTEGASEKCADRIQSICFPEA